MGAICSSDGSAAFASIPYGTAPWQQKEHRLYSEQESHQQLDPSLADPAISSLPLSELTPGELISVQGHAGQFNPAPVLDSAWLRGALSEAEWQADVASINAAALSAGAGGSRATLDSAGVGSPGADVLFSGTEFIAFTHSRGSATTAHRVFLWYEDAPSTSVPSTHTRMFGSYYWNDRGPVKDKAVARCFSLFEQEDV